MFTPYILRIAALVACLIPLAVGAARADDAQSFSIAEGLYSLPTPAGWKREQPRVRIIEHEFSVPAAEGDSAPGRVTVMGAAGGVEANVDRWRDQFRNAEGGPAEAKVEELKIRGMDVYIVDIAGTYMDKPGPFVPGPGIPREGYRMLSAIIRTVDPKNPEKATGDYFIKFYGPQATINAQADAFRKMVEGIENK